MAAPPTREARNEYENPRNPLPVDFSAAVAPGGDPWSEFVDKAYQGVTWSQTHNEEQEPNPYGDYALYWNDLINGFGGQYGYNPQTGLRATEASPEFRQVAATLPENMRFQAGENVAGQWRQDDMNIFGDEFFQALTALGLATGGAALFGGFGGAALAGGAGADVLAGGGVGGAASPSALATSVGPGAAAAVPGVALGALGAGALGLEATFPAAAGAGAVGASSAGGLLGSLAPWAPVIGAGIGAVGSVIGGAQAADAARDAANTQVQGAQEANQFLRDIYEQQRADLAPYREAGTQALGQLAGLAGQPLTMDPYTAPAGLDPSGFAFDQSQYAFTPPNQALDPAAYSFQAPNQALDPAAFAFHPSVQPFDPSSYAFTPPSGQEVLNQDPGYQWRLEQGMKALEGGAAARGGLLSGRTVQGAQQYGQGLASQEYGNAYNRLLGQNQLRYGRDLAANEQTYGRELQQNQLGFDRARYGNETQYSRALNENQLGFDRARYGNETQYNRALAQNQLGYERGLQGNQLGYGRALAANQDAYARGRDQYGLNLGTQQNLRNMRWNELAGLAGIGQTAQGQQNQLGAQFGQNYAQNLTSAAAANAAGGIGASNAWMGALGGVGNAANQYLNYSVLQDQLRNQNQQNQLLTNLYQTRR